MSAPEPQVRPTRYEVSCLPDDDLDAHVWAVTVEYRGRGMWAVLHLSRCLGRDGTWSYESIPSERGEKWLAAHRFELDTALALAREQAPKVQINGFTAADYIARSVFKGQAS